MSYCVHCGVELADYAKKCPLCETPVIDPNRAAAKSEPAFVDMVETGKKVNKRFVVLILSVVLLIPFIVTTVLDITLSLGMTWSAYVLSAEAMVWLWFILPIQCPNTSPYLFCLIDGIAAALYVFLISVIENGKGWYLPLALPIVVAATIEIMIMTLIHRTKKLGKLTKAGLVIFALSFLPLVIDIAINSYSFGKIMVRWSWYASLPLFVLGLTITVLSKSVRFTEWLRKKMYI